MGEKSADIGDVREEAHHQRVVARLADGDALEGSVLDRAELMVKLVDGLAVLGPVVLPARARVSRRR